MNSAIDSEMSGSQPKRSTVRKPLWVILAIVAILAVCVPLVTWSYLLRTDYATGFSKTEFEQLKPGDTLNVVLGRLKAPLNFAIVSQRQDDSRYQPQYSDDVSTLSKWTNDDSVVLILRYSKPRNPDGDYRAREVWIRKGTVQETRAYNYWD
jgi:hypothetical protein